MHDACCSLATWTICTMSHLESSNQSVGNQKSTPSFPRSQLTQPLPPCETGLIQRELTQPSCSRKKCPNLRPIAVQATTPVPRHPLCVKSVSAQVRPSSLPRRNRPARSLKKLKANSQQVTSRTSARPLGRTSRARRARHSSKIRVSLRNQRRTASHPSTSQRSLRTSFVFLSHPSSFLWGSDCAHVRTLWIGAELRIGSWRPKRNKGRRRRRTQIEPRNG